MCSLQSQHFLNSPLLIFPKFNDNPKFHLNRTRNFGQRIGALSSVEEFLPNATRRKKDSLWRGGFSLGVDLGLSRTGLALSKGFCVRPLTVLKLRGEKLELQLLEIAQREETDEFIIGLPKSWDGSETPQSNKVRSVAGRLAVRAAERGWRVYLLDEHRTSAEAVDRMINMGLSKSARQTKTDAYAAVILLERYFSMSGQGTEIVLPKRVDLQEKLRKGALDNDFSQINLRGDYCVVSSSSIILVLF